MANESARSASLPSLFAITLLLGGVACSSGDDDDERADHPAASARCPVVTRGGGCRAATWKEVVTVASGGLLYPAAGFARGADGFDAFAIRWGDARLLSIRTTHPWAFDKASTLPWDARGATGVTTHGENVVYVAGGDFTQSLQVATLRDGALEGLTKVAIEGSTDLPFWPQATALADGRVLLAFVAPQQRVVVGVDDGSGRRFHMDAVPLVEPSLQGVLAHVGTTAQGAWVLTYQVADAAWWFRSHVLMSRDEGRSWSNWNQPARSRLPGDVDISDAVPFARVDEGADIYYVKKTTERTVCRRALHEDGTLGVEQLVTSSTVGGVSKPLPQRLPDGRIALMMSMGYSTKEKDVVLVVLDGDAPP